MIGTPEKFWSARVEDVLAALGSNLSGLTPDEAARLLASVGPNTLKKKRRTDVPALLWNQFRSPIILILVAAAGISVFLRDRVDALIILIIVLASGLLGFWQERGSSRAMEKLLAIVQVRTAVLRGDGELEVPLEQVVPGDVVVL